ncbi:MAG: aconitate hydratase AcnA, partial [Candidatus Hydrothermae bacterium]|nr:aconitate hydratase AcnA [Candidatus Hydrothermae bacterium]
MLGQPLFMLIPEVVGVRLVGELPEGATATDLVLTLTEMLRKHGVVGKFVEYFGPGLSNLPLPDRATIANMAPEYGSTMGFFPVDEQTLIYLKGTAREDLVPWVEHYTRLQRLFRTDDAPEPEYSSVLELDLSTVEPSVAGPRRPQDRIPLVQVKQAFYETLKQNFGHPVPEDGERWEDEGGATGGTAVSAPYKVEVRLKDEEFVLRDGSVVIAAITSCTNTSNPSVMVGAALVAKRAVERGLRVKPYVKTSFAPGSRVVVEYLERAGLLPYLEALQFHVVGFGCTTCIGNSGPLPEVVERAIREGDLVVASVLSGNRNFEARIHPLVKTNYLASPLLVVAYALAGRIDIDFEHEPPGYDPNGEPVYLRDIWPTQQEIRDAVNLSLDPELYRRKYADVFTGEERWQALKAPGGDLYEWDPGSTYIQEPPFFVDMPLEVPPLRDIEDARVLVVAGDTVTTDHISPAGAIHPESPAGKYLISRGIDPRNFNTYGSRRGNHEVMIRGTFANVRFKNLLAGGREGWWTLDHDTGEVAPIYDVAMKFKSRGVPLLVIAGKEYGTGSSRDWAAKGTALLGVRAVIAESFERIHRSNLVGMGVLPLQFLPGENRESLGLTGREIYTIHGSAEDLEPGKKLTVVARDPGSGKETRFQVITRLDTPVEIEYYQNGGILQTVLRRMVNAS